MHECNGEYEEIDDRAYRTTPRLKILLSSSSVRARASPERNMNFSQTDGRTDRVSKKKREKKKKNAELFRTDSNRFVESCVSSPIQAAGRRMEGSERQGGTTVYYYRSRVSTVKISDRQRLSVAGVRPLGRHRSRKRGSDWFPGRVS